MSSTEFDGSKQPHIKDEHILKAVNLTQEEVDAISASLRRGGCWGEFRASLYYPFRGLRRLFLEDLWKVFIVEVMVFFASIAVTVLAVIFLLIVVGKRAVRDDGDEKTAEKSSLAQVPVTMMIIVPILILYYSFMSSMLTDAKRRVSEKTELIMKGRKTGNLLTCLYGCRCFNWECLFYMMKYILVHLVIPVDLLGVALAGGGSSTLAIFPVAIILFTFYMIHLGFVSFLDCLIRRRGVFHGFTEAVTFLLTHPGCILGFGCSMFFLQCIPVLGMTCTRYFGSAGATQLLLHLDCVMNGNRIVKVSEPKEEEELEENEGDGTRRKKKKKKKRGKRGKRREREDLLDSGGTDSDSESDHSHSSEEDEREEKRAKKKKRKGKRKGKRGRKGIKGASKGPLVVVSLLDAQERFQNLEDDDEETDEYDELQKELERS